MKKLTWLLALGTASLLAACGSSSSGSGSTTDSTSTGSGGGSTTEGTGGTGGSDTGATTGSTSTTSTTATGTGGSTSTSTGTGGTAPEPLNGCVASSAEDHTADTAVSISFGGALGFAYSPPCIKVKTGTAVTFNGAFASHPLSGGDDGTKDASSPIKETTSGSTATFTLSTAGAYGFFCEFHVGAGMKGAIFVTD